MLLIVGSDSKHNTGKMLHEDGIDVDGKSQKMLLKTA